MASVPIEQAKTPFVLTIDVGTSSARALLYDARASVIDGMIAQIAHEMETTPDGGVFCDADALVARVEQVIDGVLEKAGRHADKIGGVASDTFWHTVLGVDRAGKAVTPVLTWADTRSDGAAAHLRRQLDERTVHERTGCMLHPMYLPAKLLWLAQSDAAVMRRTAYWLSFAEYFLLKFFGERACSLSMASGSGLLNLNEQTWDDLVLGALPISADQLSPLRDVNQPLTGLAAAYARRWPALARLPWYLSLGDGAASNLGSGGVNDRRIAINAGTSTAMRLVVRSDTVRVPDGLWAYRVDGGHFVVGGAESNGGNVWAWLNERLRLGDGDAAAAVGALAPDSHGLTALPFLAGERSPNYNAGARGAIVGLRLGTTDAEIARAFLEAMCYRFRAIYRIIAVSYPQAREIIASGAALLHDPVWLRILADVLGQPLVVSEEAEATSRGAALIGLVQLGAIQSWEETPAAFGTTIAPDMRAHDVYTAAMERHEHLYGLLVPPRA